MVHSKKRKISPKIQPNRRRKKSKKSSKSKFGLWSLKWLTIGTIWGAAVGFCCIIWFGYDLPDTKRLLLTTRQPGITIVAQDGTTIATHGDIYGVAITIAQIPDYVPNAILATEDRRFYNHFGIDLLGVMRAVWVNYHANSVVQGGSTITQQLAKNFLLSEKMYNPSDRSLRRKIQEVMLALWLERKFSKKQILNIYLNRVYLGAGVYGIEAAAKKYFGRSARNLTLYEAAVIAGLLKAPSRYSPTSNPILADERAQTVLKNMQDAGFITAHNLKNLKLSTQRMRQTHDAVYLGRHFTDWIVETIPDYIGEINQDLVVVTTLSSKLQRIAEEKAYAILHEQGASKPASELALVSMTPDGAIKAMIGGSNYTVSQFNRATQALRQTGSAFKLFVYLAALEYGYKLNTMVSDLPIRIGKWQPKNFGWQSKGQIRLIDAFANSVNTATVRISTRIGKRRITEITRRLGLTSKMADDLSIALGSADATPLQLTAAYAAVANNGHKVSPYGIIEIKDRNNRSLYRHKKLTGKRVITSENAAQIQQMLTAVMQYGTGRNAAINGTCYGKTGTSQNYRDAWFVGYAKRPALVTGVWFGNDNGQAMKNVTGSTLPALLWKQFMKSAA